MRYSNAVIKAAGMGSFALGDLYRWWNSQPTFYANWKAQAATENQTITNWLTNGTSDVRQVDGTLPLAYELSQNYPNPFNPSTQIDYALPQRSSVTLRVFNLLGIEVATLASGVQEAGKHVATFDAARFSSGIYFYRLQAGNVSITKKMVLMK